MIMIASEIYFFHFDCLQKITKRRAAGSQVALREARAKEHARQQADTDGCHHKNNPYCSTHLFLPLLSGALSEASAATAT